MKIISCDFSEEKIKTQQKFSQVKAERHEQEVRRDKLVDEGRKLLARATAYKEKVKIFYKKQNEKTF